MTVCNEHMAVKEMRNNLQVQAWVVVACIFVIAM